MKLTTAKCTGTDGSTAATAACSCGTNNVQVQAAEFCFVKADKTGVKSSAATIMCAGVNSDGSAAAGGAGCYCGTSGTLAGPTKASP